MNQGHFLQKRNWDHAEHRSQRKSGMVSASPRNHFIEPIGRLFPKTQVTAQQSRGDVGRVIQIVQCRLSREIKGDGGQQRQAEWHTKFPLTFFAAVAFYFSSKATLDRKSTRLNSS